MQWRNRFTPDSARITQTISDCAAEFPVLSGAEIPPAISGCDGIFIRQTYESRPVRIERVREQSKERKGNPLFCVRMPQERLLLFPRVRTAGNQARPDRARQGAGRLETGSAHPPVPCMIGGYRYPPISMVLPAPPHRSHPHLLAVVGLAMGKIPCLEKYLQNVNERMHYHSLAPPLMRFLCHKM